MVQRTGYIENLGKGGMETRVASPEQPPTSQADRGERFPSFSAVRSSKCRSGDQSGPDLWHPYYAAFSKAFVTDVLVTLGLSRANSQIILDPWNGSGTTTWVAQQEDIRAIGLEINPVMVAHALAKTVLPDKEGPYIIRKTSRVLGRAMAERRKRQAVATGLAHQLTQDSLASLLSLESSIQEEPFRSDYHPLAQAVIPQPSQGSAPSIARSFLASALFQCLRECGTFATGSNPTWIRRPCDASQGRQHNVFEIFRLKVEGMLVDLETSIEKWRRKARRPLIVHGDSKRMPLCDSSIDVVITSPPYCTRIDYAVSTRPELMLLGFSEEALRDLRRATMGAPVITPGTIRVQSRWGRTCTEFLDSVAQHPSKASSTYYHSFFRQYFRDAEASLREILRVLKPGGYAVLVLQSSYYKEIQISLAEMYREMALCLGLEGEIARREVVRQHMANLNSRSRRYVDDKMYYEDVLLLRKRCRK